MSKETEKKTSTAGKNKVWIDTKLPTFFTKAKEMLHHNKDKDILRHLETHVSSPETVYHETIQIIESGRFTINQAMELMTTVLEHAQLTQMHHASGQRFFGHT